MTLTADLEAKFQHYGTGRRGFGDEMFAKDKPPPRFGIYDEDEENLYHELIKITCHIPSCTFSAECLKDFENHYNTSHRYACCQCKRSLPSPHLLDLHIQETHDSFFAVLATRKPSYCCYIEECKEKFINPDERSEHCTKVHKLPKDFRFNNIKKHSNNNKKKKSQNESMEVEGPGSHKNAGHSKTSKPANTKRKVLNIKFPMKPVDKEKQDVNFDEVMREINESLPE